MNLRWHRAGERPGVQVVRRAGDFGRGGEQMRGAVEEFLFVAHDGDVGQLHDSSLRAWQQDANSPAANIPAGRLEP